jgi:hypothetical protein
MSMKKGGGRVLFSHGFLRGVRVMHTAEKSPQDIPKSGRGGTVTPDIADPVSLSNW